MTKILIKNGRVIDPANNIDGIRDILTEDTKISKAAPDIKCGADNIIDATGKIVMPGLVDMHVHLREPGREDKETIASGTKAGLKGGVTTALAMPNTTPAIDCVENVKLLKKIIEQTAQSKVFIAGAITVGREGRELTDIAGLKKHGVRAITDDGASVDNAELFLKALKISRREGVLVIAHCEDNSLSANGAVNLGITSTRMGLRGASREAEYKRLQRDIQLAEKANACLHIAHVSCRESVELIAKAKKKGLKITAETAPHYFALTEEAAWGYDTNMKMSPPLRSKDDVEAIKEGLKNGVIDIIASDHAPHTENEKDIEFEAAEFGVIGLETELAVSITELVQAGLLSWPELARKLALNPAKILGIDKGTLGQGMDADIIVLDGDCQWIAEKEKFLSKSKNSPFIGAKLKGAVEYTICNGKIGYKA